MPLSAAQTAIVQFPVAGQARDPSPWYTGQEAADYLRCSRRLIASLVARGALPAHRLLGRKILFHRRDLDHIVGYVE